jgi:hypothetical protein
VLDEKEAFFVNLQLSETDKETVSPVPSVRADQDTPPALFTAGAGGGITRRTVWSTELDSRLALTVALFADRPGEKKNTTVPAQLPNDPPPTASAEETTAQIWQLATAGKG